MEQECLNPRVFGEWEAAFGCGGSSIAAGESSGGGLGMKVGFGGGENSGKCGVGDFVADPEKMSFMELLGLAESGAPIPAGATPAKNSDRIPDDDNGISVPPTPMEKDNGISVPPTPMEKERKTKVKTPRQQKAKRKKHRPKIFDESKPRRVPKSTTPKRENGKRKYAKRSSAMRSGMVLETSTLNPQTPGPLVEGRKKRKYTRKASKHPVKSCKRGIDFDSDNSVEEDDTCAEEPRNKASDFSIEFYANSSQYVDHKAAGSDMECALKLENQTANIYENRLTVDCAEQTRMESLNDDLSLCEKPVQSSPNQNGCKEIMVVMNQSSGQTNTLQVYQRTFRANEVEKNSRKLGPTCPSFAKKKRSKRSKRQEANKLNLWFLEKDGEEKVIAPKYALCSKFKKHLDLGVNNSLLSVLPKSQIEAAVADPESFECLSSLFALVKSKRKRSKRSYSNMGKKSSNMESLCHDLVIPKRKRSTRRRGLPSSSPITHNSPNNLKLEAPATLNSPLEAPATRNSPNNLKLEAPATRNSPINLAEIPDYPPQLARVQPHGYDSFMEKDQRLLDITTIIPTGSNFNANANQMFAADSHAKVLLRLHPQHPRPSQNTSPQHPIPFQITSPQHHRTSQSTSHQHHRTSQSNSITDITLWNPIAAAHPPPPRPHPPPPRPHPPPPRPGIPLNEYLWPPRRISLSEFLWNSNTKVGIRIHPPPRPDSAFQKYLLPTAETTSGSQGQLTKLLMETIQKLQRLQISNEHGGQLVVRDTNLRGAVIPYNKIDTPKRRKMPKVDLDPETMRRWNLLMEADASELPEDRDEKKEKEWEEQKEIFCKRLQDFVTCMHVLQGDRRFLPWKGSVVDSVVGVFLTQNVSDYLSSNAFMSLAAKFPLPSPSCDFRVDSPCSQESTSNPTGPNSQPPHETFVSSAEEFVSPVQEEPPGSLGDDRVVEVNHDFLKETLEFEQTGNSEKMHLPEEVELPTRLCGCESGIITSCTERLEDMNGAHASPSLFGFNGNLGGFGCDCGEQKNKNLASTVDVNKSYGSKSGCGCSCVRGIFEQVAKDSANSNTLLNELEDNTVQLISTEEVENTVQLNNTEEVAMEENTVNTEEVAMEENTHPLNNTEEMAIENTVPLNNTEEMAIENTVPLNNTQENTIPNNNQENTIPNNNQENTIPLNNTQENTSKKGKVTKIPKPDVDWEELRRTYYNPNRTPGINIDSIDWNAVRCAPVGEIAKVIETRGMNNVLAAKIKAFLNRLVEDHGSIDLEWLKDVPPDKAKEFLLSIRGVGLKSTECVRLLTLGHHAFPVDTNIARIVVRLGWVPLEPLPGDLQIHLLEQYPLMDSIQKYLWPRLCTLDKKLLYLLHYQLITFGKVLCTKKNPNCNACPLRAECKHFASAFASSRLRLRGAPEKPIRPLMLPYIERDIEDFPCGFKDKDDNSHIRQPVFPHLEKDIEDFHYEFKDMQDGVRDYGMPNSHMKQPGMQDGVRDYGMPNSHTKQPDMQDEVRDYGMPNSHTQQPDIQDEVRDYGMPTVERDIEDFRYGFKDMQDEVTDYGMSNFTKPVPHIDRDIEDFSFEFKDKFVSDIEDFPSELDNQDEKSNIQTYIIEEPEEPEPESTVSLERDTTNILEETDESILDETDETKDDNEIPTIKLDTEKFKRNLIDLLNPKFEDEEVSNALVALTPQATTIPAPKIKSVTRLRTRHQVYVVPDSHPLLFGFDLREHDDPCPYLLAIWPKEFLNGKESSSQTNTVCGTILIPCRTANKGSFPLNGTYFQVNEVFADHESSKCPINVPRKLIWNLKRSYVYCGSTTSAITKGMEMDEIQQCFWNGFVCVRAFDRQTRNPTHLSKRFHELPSTVGKKKIPNDN